MEICCRVSLHTTIQTIPLFVECSNFSQKSGFHLPKPLQSANSLQELPTSSHKTKMRKALSLGHLTIVLSIN